jgi:hypothetical protein
MRLSRRPHRLEARIFPTGNLYTHSVPIRFVGSGNVTIGDAAGGTTRWSRDQKQWDRPAGIQLAKKTSGDICMRLSLLFTAGAALFMISGTANVFAQSHQIQPLDKCIGEFYDPGMYNYLTYKNNCAQSLTIVFAAKDGSGFTGTMDLRPGAKDSVGRSADGVVPKIGGLRICVCEVGYMPVDEKNNVVNKPQTIFRCQQKVK